MPPPQAPPVMVPERRDRKSTRLNSSHVSKPYAVFCSKKRMLSVVREREALELTKRADAKSQEVWVAGARLADLQIVLVPPTLLVHDRDLDCSRISQST